MVFEAVDSTNAYLSRAVFAGDLKPASGPMAVLALAQTAGKGVLAMPGNPLMAI